MLKNALTLVFALAIGVLLMEATSRFVSPIQFGTSAFDLEGRPLDFSNSTFRLHPGIRFHSRASEFDVLISHTTKGNRGPVPSAPPKLIFIGDSITYGTGLADDQTIPHLTCDHLRIPCVNLGRPNSGTAKQIAVLQHYLDTENWRPDRVVLIMLAMSRSFLAGNDFADNLASFEKENELSSDPGTSENDRRNWSLRRLSEGLYRTGLANSNLMRNLVYRFGPAIKKWLSPEISQQRRQLALKATSTYLKMFAAMSRTYGFQRDIVVVYPVQDLLASTYVETLADVTAIADGAKVLDTSESFGNPADAAAFYYPLDGHLNPMGAASVARYVATKLRDEISPQR
jgi:hypothetical protein